MCNVNVCVAVGSLWLLVRLARDYLPPRALGGVYPHLVPSDDNLPIGSAQWPAGQVCMHV